MVSFAATSSLRVVDRTRERGRRARVRRGDVRRTRVGAVVATARAMRLVVPGGAEEVLARTVRIANRAGWSVRGRVVHEPRGKLDACGDDRRASRPARRR